MKVTVSSLQLVCEFPFANYYETRDIYLEIAKLFKFKNFYHYGFCSEEITKKYNFSRIIFITIKLSDNVFVSFNYNNLGEYLMFLSKEDKVFEYRNHKNESWIEKEQFMSFEGLSALLTVQKFCNDEITENLYEVAGGFAFDSFSFEPRSTQIKT